MNNKNLLIIFLVLLAIYGLSRVFSSKKERSFKTELIEIDSAEVTTILINPKGEENESFTLKREDQGWIASKGDINTKATKNSIDALLGNLVQIKTKRIAAKSPEKWVEYEVEEGNGSRIQILKNDKVLEDFIVGRFSFNQQNRSATSFIRLNGQDEVYAVDGFMAMTLGQGFDAYRNKEILRLNPEMEITEFAYQDQDTSLNFTLQDGQWLLNGQLPLDSAKVSSYLTGLKTLNGSTFADNFDDLQSAELHFKTFLAKGNNMLEPVRIDCYRDTTREKPFVLQSSYNEEVYFESDSSGVYQQVFKNLTDFLAQ